MKLKIADTLALPADEAVSQKYAFLGRSGSGKTYGAMKLAELFLAAEAQIIALDWVGNWWALRLSQDGKSPGFEGVYIFGGEHADVPLEVTGGAMMADLLVDKHISAVLDLSPFRKGERTRFATAFAEQLFHRKKTARTACHLFLEEAQAFLPQMVRGDDARMVGVFEDIGKIGRNYGIGVSILSQRPQAVNKDVLNQTEVLFAFQTNGPQERKTIGGWVVEHGDADVALVNELPTLPRGDAFVWSPQWLQIRQRVHIAARRTYDASSTPTQRATTVKPTALTPADLESLGEAMKATVERAKADDPKALRVRIQTLERELKAKPAAAAPAAQTIERIEVSVIQPEHLRAIAEAVRTVRDESAILRAAFEKSFALASEQIVAAASPLLAALGRAEMPAARSHHETTHQRAEPRREGQPVRVDRAASRRGEAVGALGMGERKIRSAIAHYPNGASREQLTVLTGYKKSSRDTYLRRLAAAGQIASTNSGDLVVTDAGIAALGDGFEPLPTGRDLRDYWLDRLTGGEQVILAAIIRAYPRAVEREALSERTDYKKSSRDTYLQRLISRRLVTVEGRGAVRASDTLFE